MSVWWTYSLRDLLLFAPHTYYRLFELYNLQLWPLQLVWIALGMVSYLLWWRHSQIAGRVISAILTLTWLWVAWAYHLQHYAQINWAANYYAAACLLQALLLFWRGVIRNQLSPIYTTRMRQYTGSAVFIFSVLCFPLYGLLFGRSLSQAEVFGMAPDPTALATLGMLLLLQQRPGWLLYFVPLLWCAISSATLWAMHAPDYLLLPLIALLACGIALHHKFESSTTQSS